MKAGTTWLYAFFKRHPELRFTPQKELHYFYHKYVNPNQLNEDYRFAEAHSRYQEFTPGSLERGLFLWYLKWAAVYLDNPVDDAWFNRQFPLQGAQRYACDFSNLHAHLPAKAWTDIESKCDTLRVLYSMRDPVKRLWSHTKFELQMNGQLDQLSRWGPKEYERFLRQPHIWDNAEYGRALRNLKQGLAAPNLKVMFYEDIHADKHGALAEIEDFLGIARHKYPEFLMTRRFAASAEHQMPDFFPSLLAGDVARIRAEVEAEGYTVPHSWL